MIWIPVPNNPPYLADQVTSVRIHPGRVTDIDTSDLPVSLVMAFGFERRPVRLGLSNHLRGHVQIPAD